MKNISIGVWITIIVLLAMAIFCIRQLWKEWRAGRKPDTDDLLHELNFKIKFSIINEHSELALIKLIKQYRVRDDINQEKLDALYRNFIRRFSVLHEIDEHSPENLNYDEVLSRVKAEKNAKELDKFGDFDNREDGK